MTKPTRSRLAHIKAVLLRRIRMAQRRGWQVRPTANFASMFARHADVPQGFKGACCLKGAVLLGMRGFDPQHVRFGYWHNLEHALRLARVDRSLMNDVEHGFEGHKHHDPEVNPRFVELGRWFRRKLYKI